MNYAVAFPLLFMSIMTWAQKSYSPYAGDEYPTNVYWGDTHLHTYYSTDAYGTGTTLGPDEAYRLARGEIVTAHNSMKVKLDRPLDFFLIADHAENMGVWRSLARQEPLLLETETGKYWYEKLQELEEITDPAEKEKLSGRVYWGIKNARFENDNFKSNMWQEVIDNAERYNHPGRFTAFIGYEWTSSSPGNPAIHRVVIFKDGSAKTSQVLPFSQIDSNKPEDLWAYLESYQKVTGGQVLAIPHNSNLSSGYMFRPEDSKGRPFTANYAKTRARWEPLMEVTQIKGDSETHPALSPTDEFADYETWSGQKIWGSSAAPERPEYEYARSALKLGFEEQVKVGVNPFKFGLIGSTDAHTSLAAVAENNFWGKFSSNEPGPTRVLAPSVGYDWRMNAAGYAAVWAAENTREALFDAMKRKEVYASTGPRITVRFFGGWDYQSDDAFKPDFAKTGYTKGVPMGGDLTAAPKGKAPSFLIHAVKDPDGANLDRVQVIKGWRGQNGELHEKIYNVALSDGRAEDENGKAPPVGNTVNVEEASYTNTIGDPELAVVWTDPDFDSTELAFYYLRVLEIPTPRWTAYDAKYFGVKDIPKEVLMITQERAYASPIWYTP